MATTSPGTLKKDPTYIINSGASHHMVNDPLLLQDLKAFAISPQIIIGNGKALLATHHGQLVLGTVTFDDVYMVSGLDRNLISVRCVPPHCKWEFSPNSTTLAGKNGGTLITGNLLDNLDTFKASQLFH
jgi:hypothetical protein